MDLSKIKPGDAEAAVAVLAKVREFVAAQRIYCPETVYQTDRVIVHAYDFIAELCDLAGYHEAEGEG